MAAGAVTQDGRARVLADGNEIPLLGLGVWQVPDGRECEDAVRWALEAGYRHVDTAQAYGNERSVGRALRDSGLPREDVFVTTKFYPGRRERLWHEVHELLDAASLRAGPGRGQPPKAIIAPHAAYVYSGPIAASSSNTTSSRSSGSA